MVKVLTRIIEDNLDARFIGEVEFACVTSL